MAQCQPMTAGQGFVSSVTSYIDCQAQALGMNGWAALSAPGSSVSFVLTGLLTIFISLIGYNLLFGRLLSVREGTLALVKIGVVVALATSWPTYRTLAYDVVTTGPFELVQEIGPRAGVTGADGTLLERLDGVDRGLVKLALLGAGTPPVETSADVPPVPFGGFESFALGASRIVFELSAVAGLAVVRIVTGLALAVGPIFIAFLLFDATRSLFEGWIRVLAGAAIGAVGVTIALGMQLAFLEPWLSDALIRRTSGEALPSIPTEAFALAALWALIIAAALFASARIAHAFRLPSLPVSGQAAIGGRPSKDRDATLVAAPGMVPVERGRAGSTADAISAASLRHSKGSVMDNRTSAVARRSRFGREDGPNASFVPTGRSFSRRAQQRVSMEANRRDGRQ